ncbi:MAG: heat-inducible transcriptional repressor HrcA [Desulfotomaculales bacterium]
MQIDERKQKILWAVVEDYIATAEPVGSRTIARKYKLGVSPATIRNEMADLEEMGLLEQPHTSAGRVPSYLGYRYYVDFLMHPPEVTDEEKLLIRENYRAKVQGVGEVIKRTGQILSELTSYAAVVAAPYASPPAVKHVQLVPFSGDQAMVLVVMDQGAVHHRLLDLPPHITEEDLAKISQVLNAKLRGVGITEIKLTILHEIYGELIRYRRLVTGVVEALRSIGPGHEQIYRGGLFKMLNQPEFKNLERVKTLLSLLEQEDFLCDLLASQTDGSVRVRIGREVSHSGIDGCSVVTAGYTIGGRLAGALGVLGPTRMDYARVVSIMSYLTEQLSRVLEEILYGQKTG